MVNENNSFFGTDGIRGKANIFPMTADVALKVGMAAGVVFRNENKNKRTKIVIGKDTRISGYMIEYAITAGIVSMGVDVLLVGPMPTPAIAHLTKSFGADAGIVISASHNPYEDNGIKFFGKDGFKISITKEKEIESLILKNNFDTSMFSKELIGKAKRIDDAAGRYIEFSKASIQNMSLSGLKIVLDCANGAAYKIAPLIFEELGAQVITINNSPNGLNINENAGALHPKTISDKVKSLKANIGIALDGDADRIIVCDEKGEVLDGDEILAIASNYFLGEKDSNKVVVATVMSNFGLEESLKNIGVKLVRTDVGDKYVIDSMRTLNAKIGGEQSGHIIFSDFASTGDGIISGLQILKIMKETGKKLSELKKVMKKYPQTLVNIRVKSKKPIESMTKIVKIINDSEKELKNEGRILVRYSGTENKCRVMVEGKNQKLIESIANNISDAIKKEIGE